MPTINERIVPLDEMDDFEVAEGDPDVRGWQVYSGEGMLIGVVDGLLVDAEALKVRYLDVELAGDGDATGERHILLPIGRGRLHEVDDRILIEGIAGEVLQALPSYTGEPLTHEYERELLRQIQLRGPSQPAADRYADDAYDDDRFYRARRKGAS